jgi:Holliday junction resolvase RusA-like endonuclease
MTSSLTWQDLPDPVARIRDCWPRPAPHFEIVVVGMPAPQGSKVPMGRNNAGRILMRESSKAVAPWRESVERATLRLISPDGEGRTINPGFPLKGPLVAEMVFTMPKPAAAPKRRRSWPATARNDTSKLTRSTEDALKIAHAIKDDGLIVEYVRLAKVFPGEDRDALAVTGAVIRVWSVDLLPE